MFARIVRALDGRERGGCGPTQSADRAFIAKGLRSEGAGSMAEPAVAKAPGEAIADAVGTDASGS